MLVTLQGRYRLRNGEIADVRPSPDHASTRRHVGVLRCYPGLGEITWDGRGIADPPNPDLDVMDAVRSGEGL